MSNVQRFGVWLSGALCMLSITALAQQPTTIQGADTIGGPVTPVIINVDPATLPPPSLWQPGDPIREIPLSYDKDFTPPPREPRPNGADPLVARQFEASANRGGTDPDFGTIVVNEPGTGFTGVNPSDTVGDIGNNFYLQTVNGGGGVGGTQVLILDKTDGMVAAMFDLEDLAAGSGTGCTNASGDPIVNFDETVDNGPGMTPGRWVVTEFTGNSFCVYISQTDDPTIGSWFLYEFISATGGLPDYPKYGVWPDAYYIGANEGPRQYALDRVNMVQGLTARTPLVFTGPGLPGFGFQHIMPVDWDGDLEPPPGSPGLFMRHRDTEIHGPAGMPTTDIIELWEFVADFDTPGNSSFTGPINVSVTEFDSEFCNLIFSGCLEQPGSTTTLFALLQPIMWRAQYRNFGSYESLVANMVTDVTDTDIGGVRWFELRSMGAGYTSFQEGTVTEPGPINGTDGISRWMASVAQDEAGNIVAGYNVVGVGDAGAGDDVFPGMRYNGRLFSDPMGTMPQGETSIIEGLAPNSSIRYGDYTSLNVDPVDGCTFWFTAQHNATTNWSTQIASFRFAACGEPGFTLSAPNAQQQVCAPDDLDDIPISVGSISDFVNPVTLMLDSPPTGFSANFTVNPVIPGNDTVAQISVSGAAAVGDNLVDILGTASGADDRTLTVLAEVFNQVPDVPTLQMPANAATLISVQPELVWMGTGQTSEFIIEIDDDPGFGSIDYTATVTASPHIVGTPLDSNTTYFWRVRSGNACGEQVSQVFNFTTEPAPGDCPIGIPANVLFDDDIENGDNGWTHSGTQDTWQRSGSETTSGSFAWFAEDLASISDQRLVSPAITLPTGELPMVLRYQNSQTIEDDAANNACWDAAILEISTDDGANWTQITDMDLVTDPYDGTVNNFMGGPNPLAGLQGWCADPEDFVESVVDLSGFQGETVRFRFRLGTDGTVGRGGDGWFIDDVRVQSCPGGEDILVDGFEDLVR